MRMILLIVCSVTVHFENSNKMMVHFENSNKMMGDGSSYIKDEIGDGR